MDMDIRTPMGLMFSMIGAIIAVYGAVTPGDAMYKEHSLGININLWWGLVMTAFGIAMLLLAWHGAKRSKPAESGQAGGPGH